MELRRIPPAEDRANDVELTLAALREPRRVSNGFRAVIGEATPVGGGR